MASALRRDLLPKMQLFLDDDLDVLICVLRQTQPGSLSGLNPVLKDVFHTAEHDPPSDAVRRHAFTRRNDFSRQHLIEFGLLSTRVLRS